MPENLDLVIVGSIALDSIRTPFGAHERILGGSASFAGTSSGHLARVGLVGVIGDDFPPEHLEFLKSQGLDLEGVYQEKGTTFFWRGYYEGNMAEAHTEDTQLGVFEHFKPTIPDRYKNAPFLFLGNIHPALQMSVLDQMSGETCTALDTMNFWIHSEPQLLQEVVSKVDVLFINETEAQQISGLASLVPAAEWVLERGPKVVVIKRGEHGATVHHAEGIAAVPALPLRDVKDPTGAGDTFAGGFMGYLAQVKSNLNLEDLRAALWMGTTLASFTVQGFSLDGLNQAREKGILERLHELEKMVCGRVPEIRLSHG